MQEEYNTSAIEESAEKLLNTLPELKIADDSLTPAVIAERKFLRQVFRPLCYYVATYEIVLEKQSLKELIKILLERIRHVDESTIKELEEKYVTIKTPIDWVGQARLIRDPKNLFTTPSPDPLLRLSYACHQALPKPVRQHLALVFYFGSDE